MDDLSVRIVGVCVLLTWSLAACTSTRTDPVRPSPDRPLAQSEETSDPGEPTLRTFHHEDFPVHEHLATAPRWPVSEGIDGSEWKMIWTLDHLEDPTPNFAGRFLAVTHGCGTGCHVINFIDLSTGIWRKDLDKTYYYYSYDDDEPNNHPFGPTIHLDSRLLTISHRGELGEGCYHYELTDDRFELLHYEAWDTAWNRGE